MDIRSDFQPVSLLLSRLIQYAKVFEANNMTNWPHLKNREDFNAVYRLPWESRGPLEAIYADGRDLAVFMSSRLIEFNYPDTFPTLKSFVASFRGGWIDQIDLLRTASQKAKDVCSGLENTPWAVTQMIDLFDNQIELLLTIQQTIEGLKQSDIYKWEDGAVQHTFPGPEYKRVLDCVHSVGKMFERLPNTYTSKDEEALRDHILVSLESIVYGSATGETFNKRGKTDILVRGNGCNEFVGECKFWHGKEVFLQTVTQLLNYLSWRDTKTAVIIFVRNVDFTDVLRKVKEHISEHAQYIRFVGERDETWLSYEFRMIEDPSRVVEMAVMLYHLPEANG